MKPMTAIACPATARSCPVFVAPVRACPGRHGSTARSIPSPCHRMDERVVRQRDRVGRLAVVWLLALVLPSASLVRWPRAQHIQPGLLLGACGLLLAPMGSCFVIQINSYLARLDPVESVRRLDLVAFARVAGPSNALLHDPASSSHPTTRNGN